MLDQLTAGLFGQKDAQSTTGEDAIKATKLVADSIAEIHAAGSKRILTAKAKMGAAVPHVAPNFKFFRRLAGLRNGDLTK